MSTIADLRGKKDQPYQLPLRVKVIDKGVRKSYMANDTKKEFIPFVIADATGAIRVNMYDLNREAKLDVGNCIFLRGYVLRSEQRSGKKYIVVTAVTKIFKAPDVCVGENVLAEGGLILNPPPAPEKDLKTAKSSPMKTMISVKGQIISEEIPQTRQIGGNEVKVKAIVIKDESGSCKVSLWRDMTNKDIQTGDFIQVKNVLVTSFRNEVSLSTTSMSRIVKTEQPLESKKLTLEGFEIIKDNHHFLVSCNGEFLEEQITAKSSLVLERYGDEDINLVLPLEVTVSIQGNEIKQFIE